MAEWTDVAPAHDIEPGTSRCVYVDATPVAVFNVDGTFYAIEDVCTHDGGLLTGGPLVDDVVVCPRHGARFNVKTGAVLAPPAYEDVPTFEVRVENGMVQVR